MHSLFIQAAWPVRMTESHHKTTHIDANLMLNTQMHITSASCLTTVHHLHALTFLNSFQVSMTVPYAYANFI